MDRLDPGRTPLVAVRMVSGVVGRSTLPSIGGTRGRQSSPADRPRMEANPQNGVEASLLVAGVKAYLRLSTPSSWTLAVKTRAGGWGDALHLERSQRTCR
jgi:hypothetical protein